MTMAGNVERPSLRAAVVVALGIAALAAVAWSRVPAEIAPEPRAPAYDPMDDVEFANDCQPCRNDPWLYCCRSMGTVQLTEEAQAALADVAKLRQREETLLRMMGAILKATQDVEARVAKLEPKRKRRAGR